MRDELKRWDDYLSLNNTIAAAETCHSACSECFEAERKRLLQVWRHLKAESVLCLGAGCLNDIPVREFLESGARVTLVDWIPGLTRAGMAREMVYGSRESPECIGCRIRKGSGKRICENYMPREVPQDVCRNFCPASQAGCFCANYSPGEQPEVLEEDVSGGVSRIFAESVIPCLVQCPSPTVAVRRMKKVLNSLSESDLHLALPSASFDLVISGMVVSQFDFEPLQYFTRQLLARYEIRDSDRAALENKLQDLRRALFTKTLSGHLKEIRRLLKPGGRAYMSFEMFHRKRNSPYWFIPDHVAASLEEIGRHFLCSFEVNEPAESMTRVEMLSGESVIRSFLLVRDDC